MVETAVLYIAYCRPEYARQSFDAIKRAKPKKLYFYSNIAREGHADEIKRNNEVRAMAKEVDWDCELKTYFRDEYLDMYPSLWTAIDWVFSNEEKAIVIEEDCVATKAFFDFCESMLAKYENDKNVWLISGNNFTPEYSPTDKNYFFSKYLDIWGWAGWRNRWNRLDRTMSSWPTQKGKAFAKYWNSFIQSKWMQYRFKLAYDFYEKTGSGPWDYCFWYNASLNNGKFLKPSINLVVDVEMYGTNHNPAANMYMKEKKFSEIESFQIVNEPNSVEFDSNYDNKHFWKHILGGTLSRKTSLLLHKFLIKNN